MKSMSNSFIFKELIDGNNLRNKIKNINLDRDYVSPSRISAIETLNKKFNFPLKTEVMKYLNTNKIKIIYNKDNAFPRYMNIVVRKDSIRGAYAIVDITNYATLIEKGSYAEVDNDGRPIEILPKILYTFLLNATISIIFADKGDKMLYETNLYRWASMSYTKLVCKILDKMMGIGINEERSDVVHYLVSKFFLISVVGMNDIESTNKIAMLSVYDNTSYEFLNEMEIDLKKKRPNYNMYSDINNFFIVLQGLATLEKLNFRSFMEQWLRMYGETTMLAVDYLPSFISLTFSTEINAGINKDYIIDNVAGRTNSKVISEFCKLV